MKPAIEQGLRWAAAFGLGVGLMLGAAFSLLWRSGAAAGETVDQTCEPVAVKESQEEQVNPAGSEEGATGRTIAFSVLPGMSFQDIADLLEAAGAVEDRDAFVDRARELGALDRAQPGVYVLTQSDPEQPLGADDIIAQLVSGPSQ